MRFLFGLLFALPLLAQTNSTIFYTATAPSGSCTARASLRLWVPSGGLYGCKNGTWGAIGGTSGTVTGVTGTANEIDVTMATTTPSLSISQTFDISGHTSTAPIKKGTSLPATCNVGEYYDKTDATAGINTYSCTAANTWAVVGTSANQNIRTLGYHFDGGGSALTGTKVYCVKALFAGTITGWYIDADVAGSGTYAIRKVAFGSYTGTAGFAGYTDVTGGGTAPVLTTAVTATFANLTSWVTAVTAGDEYCFQISSPATSTWENVYLTVAAN